MKKMSKGKYFYLILRHGDTSNDILDKKKYSKYAHKIIKYIFNICKHKNKAPIFLSSPQQRCIDTIEILYTLYNEKYGTHHTSISTQLLNRSGSDEHSKEKYQRLNEFIDFSNQFNENKIIVCVTHSSIIPALCPLIAGIDQAEFKEKFETYLSEGALAFIKKNSKILRYNRSFN